MSVKKTERLDYTNSQQESVFDSLKAEEKSIKEDNLTEQNEKLMVFSAIQKKIISIILSLALFYCFLLTGFSVQANTMDTAEAVVLNQQIDVTVSGEVENKQKQWLSFECAQSGYYDLCSENSLPTNENIFVTVYDANKKALNFFANSDCNTAFTFATYLNAGAVYYYLIEASGPAVTLSLSVKNHSHSFSVSQAVPAVADDDTTLREDGEVRHICTGCGFSYISQAFYYPQSIVLSGEKQVYNGNTKMPTVTVYDRAGNVIPANEYVVSYTKNIKPGKAYVTVSFNSYRYLGELSKSFFIYPKKTKLISLTASPSKKMKLKWEKDTTVTGYEIKYSTSKKFSKSKTVKITKNSTSSKTISSLKANKRYYVKIRAYKVYKNTYKYGAWSSVKSVKIKK